MKVAWAEWFAWTEPLRVRWIALGTRWNALDARDRRVLSALAVCLAPLLFYLLVWNPVQGGLAAARARLSLAQAQLARVEEQAAQVARIRSSPRVAQPADPVAAVQQAGDQFGLRAQLKRVEAEGARAVRVQVEGASFWALTAWLTDLQQRSGIRAESAAFEKQADPGIVNARLLLRAQGA
ncbi:MAG TPA: type II secretion system protein M [Burkholderiales bacterium]